MVSSDTETGNAGPVRVVVAHGGRELSGVVHRDEAWRQAADRVAATVPGTPTAVDLSSAEKRFAVDPDLRVALRAMSRADLADVARWRATDHVRRWWQEEGEPTLEEVTRSYGPSVDRRTPTSMWVVEVNGRSVAFLQDYRLADYPEYAALAPDPEAVGVDYAIGEQAWVGRGIGVRMLWAWLLGVRHRYPEARSIFAAPDHRNRVSLRVLAKTGFQAGTWFDEPQPDGTTTTMVGCSLDLATVVG